MRISSVEILLKIFLKSCLGIQFYENRISPLCLPGPQMEQPSVKRIKNYICIACNRLTTCELTAVTVKSSCPRRHAPPKNTARYHDTRLDMKVLPANRKSSFCPSNRPTFSIFGQSKQTRKTTTHRAPVWLPEERRAGDTTTLDKMKHVNELPL